MVQRPLIIAEIHQHTEELAAQFAAENGVVKILDQFFGFLEVIEGRGEIGDVSCRVAEPNQHFGLALLVAQLAVDG